MEPGKAHGYLFFHTFHTFHTYPSYTRGRACARARVRACVYLLILVWKVWKYGRVA